MSLLVEQSSFAILDAVYRTKEGQVKGRLLDEAIYAFGVERLGKAKVQKIIRESSRD